MAAVVAAKIRKARKEEEEAKQHNLDFYQVPTLQRNLDLCIPRKGIARTQSQFFPHWYVRERSIYSHGRSTLQIILDLCIPEKELAKTLSQISFI